MGDLLRRALARLALTNFPPQSWGRREAPGARLSKTLAPLLPAAREKRGWGDEGFPKMRAQFAQKALPPCNSMRLKRRISQAIMFPGLFQLRERRSPPIRSVKWGTLFLVCMSSNILLRNRSPRLSRAVNPNRLCL